MSTDPFAEREKGFEAKFKLDQEQEFRAQARRNKLFGLWAAEKLGRTGPEAEAYARTVVAADFQKPGHDDVIAKVRTDLEAAGTPIDERTLRAEYEKFLPVARRQIAEEAPKEPKV
ncbi:DUF1476 domain-containing protein [Elioraea sp. Yellowstone]|jgi:hypothetical protein|uniref:DUF1476 domain-containing protein n=1 Tax=Elioraea sp. Yellowstone TaxID=2592070 RepID=UPI00114DF6EA|nr:DUF1476 domain-containing protein [Elioraea sp. Yellowstone]TQF76700.1 DUF1476 domain-containing protein [Elioraea sp. Yellowstone]